MAPRFAELALGSAPKRLTADHVAALVEADQVTKQLAAERAVRELKRQRRIERERAAREAAARGERAHMTAVAGLAAVAKATREGQR